MGAATRAAACCEGWPSVKRSWRRTWRPPESETRGVQAHGGGAEGALVALEHREERDVGEDGAEQIVFHEAEGEATLASAAAGELHLDRDHVRGGPDAAGDGGGAVLVHRAHGVGRGGDLPRLVEAGEDRVDVGLLHRELDGPEVVERVAEGVHAPVLVDVGDGARHREVEVALDERHPDRAPGLEVGQGRLGKAGARRPHHRREAVGGEHALRPLEGGGIEAREHHGQGQGREPRRLEAEAGPWRAAGKMARSGRSRAATTA